MGQQKGNPVPSYQNQAYETLRSNGGARASRDMGTKPVMIDDMTTLTAVVDATFGTDVDDTNIWNHLGTITGSSWTPTISSKAGLFNSTVNVVKGNYQKIGNLVNFAFHAEFENASGQSAGTFKFDLPVTPNNNFSGSFSSVLGTTNLRSGANVPVLSSIYTNTDKLVTFDGNRTNSSAASTIVYVTGQYNINN
jgi:hypothetical protein